jgi:hypothetical protein
LYLKNRIIIFFISLFRFVFYFFPSIILPLSSYQSISFCFSWFRFAFVGFVSFRFHFVDFVSFRFVFVDFVSLRFVFVDFVSFRFVSFLFRFALYRYPDETGGPGENHRPVASHWQTLSHNITPRPDRDSNIL